MRLASTTRLRGFVGAADVTGVADVVGADIEESLRKVDAKRNPAGRCDADRAPAAAPRDRAMR